MDNWYAHVTVATVIEKDEKYLLVHEHTESGNRFNQPAGHLEKSESLLEAAVRETKEETGWDVKVTGLVRVNQYTAPSNGVTYLRVTFSAKAIRHDPAYTLDDGIIGPVWLSFKEIKEKEKQLRSPLVISDIEFFQSQPPLPLDFVNCYN